MKRYDVWKIHRKSTKVLALAQEEALRLGHNNIGTEHILLGLVREGEGIAAKALQALGLSPDKIQKKLKASSAADKKCHNRSITHREPRK